MPFASDDNRIGTFDFVSLQGQVGQITEDLELITRPGVYGVGFWKTGQRGKPFELTSSVDTVDFASARTTYLEYLALIGADPVDLHWNVLDISTLEGIQFVVTHCELVEMKAIKTAVGKVINAPSEGWLVCRWTLVPVSASL